MTDRFELLVSGLARARGRRPGGAGAREDLDHRIAELGIGLGIKAAEDLRADTVSLAQQAEKQVLRREAASPNPPGISMGNDQRTSSSLTDEPLRVTWTRVRRAGEGLRYGPPQRPLGASAEAAV